MTATGNQAYGGLSRRTLRWVLVALVAIVGLGHLPSAQAKSRSSIQAMRAFEGAAKHYKAGRYGQAATLFHRAWSLDRQPEYLYNAARSEHRGGDLNAARRDYRRCLQLARLNNTIRTRARAHLDELRAASVAVEEAGEEGEDAPTRASPDSSDALHTSADAQARPNPWQEPLGWTSIAVGGVLAVAGTWATLYAASEQRALDGRLAKENDLGLIVGTDFHTYRDDQRAIRFQGRLGLSGALIGGILLAAGGWWLWAAPEEGAVSLEAGPTSLGMRVGF